MSRTEKPPETFPTAETLTDAIRKSSRKGPPPVHLWNPPFCGDIDMRIARDGRWFYRGSPINRPALVRLFASVLRRDGEDFFLVTPAEKVGIAVEDAPFIAVDFEVGTVEGAPILTFETNVGDLVEAGATNDIRVEEDPETGAPSPYLHVRRGLEALIDRKSFYRLAELSRESDGRMVVESGGKAFDIGPAV